MTSYEQGKASNEMDYLVDQVVKFTKKNPIKVLFGALGGIIAFAGFIGYLESQNNKREREFREQLKQFPPHGSMAYIVNDEIHTIRADQVCTEDKTIGKFQAPGSLERLIWLDNDKIIFIGKQKEEINGKLMSEYSVVSDSIYRLDVTTGNIETLFDPYSERATGIFGDVKSADELKKAEIKKFMEDEKNDNDNKNKKSRVKIVSGDHSNLNITNMGISENDKKIYVEINTKWYSLNENGEEMTLAMRIPENLRYPNNKANNPEYQINNRILFYNARFTNGNVSGCAFEDDAQNFDWKLDN